MVAVAGCGADGRNRIPVLLPTTSTTLPEPVCAPPPERVSPAPITATNLVDSSPARTLDTDGDGRPDSVTAATGVVTVTNGAGRLRFGGPGHAVSLRSWADLDGNGLDDLVLDDTTDAGAAVYVVSGRTQPGTWLPSAVGVRVDPMLTYPWRGDLDGAPGEDFVVPHRDGGRSYTDVYSGRATLAPGPGGDARGLPPTRRLEGLTRGIAKLHETGPLETLLLLPGDPAAILFAERPGVRLQALGPMHRVEDVLVFDEGGVRKIGLQIDDKVAVWPVPGPCG